jgi:hypothetical protein
VKTRILITISLLLLATGAWSQPWYLNIEEHFDGGALIGDWTAFVEAGDPCGYVDESGGMLNILSQCGPGNDWPVPSLAQHGIFLPADYKIVVRLNKASSYGWTKVILSEAPGVFPPVRFLGLFLNGDGVGGGYGSVSLRMYLDGVPYSVDAVEHAFGIGVWNVWVLTKEGSTLSATLGPNESTQYPLLEGTEAALFDGGFFTLEGSQAGVLTHVDWVKIYSHFPVANEAMSWSGIKRLYE